MSSIFRHYNDKAVEYLMEKLPDDENIDEELNNFRLHNKADELLKALDASGLKTELNSSVTNSKAVKDESNLSVAAAEAPNGRGAARGRGSRGRGRAAATSAAANRTNADTSATTTTTVGSLIYYYLYDSKIGYFAAHNQQTTNSPRGHQQYTQN